MLNPQRRFSLLLVAVSLLATPPQASARDAGSAAAGGIIGGVIGGIIGGMISHPPGQPAPQKPQAPRTVVVSERVMNIQKALAFFGFFKGSVDGVSGPSTRKAIREYLKASNLPLGDDLTDDQYAALLKQYAEKSAPAAAGGAPAKTAPPSGESPTDALFKAIESPAEPGEKAGPAAEPAIAGKPGAAIARVQLRELCIASVPLRTNSDNEQTLSIKKHLCAIAGPIAANANLRMSAPDFGNVQDFSDRCSELAEVVKSSVPFSDPPQMATQKIQAQFAGLAPEQLDQVKTKLKICLGLNWTLGKSTGTQAMALALGGTGERAIFEIIAAQLALGVDANPNPALAADWYEAAANGGGTLANLTLLGATDKPSDAAFFRGIARELREQADKSKAADSAAQAPINPIAMSNKINPAAAAPANDVSNGTPMTRPVLADHMRNAIVFIINIDGSSSGTGFFISPTMIVTNTHVVEGAKRVFVASKAIGIRSAKVIAKGMTPDLQGIDAAVLEAINFSAPQFLTFNQKIKEGQAIAIGGYPGIAQKGFDRSYDNFMAVLLSGRAPDLDNIPSPKFDFGSTQALMTNSRDGFHNIQLGLQTAHGNSGSPIVNFCGEVVGLHYEGTPVTLDIVSNEKGKPVAFGSTAHYGFALRGDEVVKFLKSLRIKFDERSTDCREP